MFSFITRYFANKKRSVQETPNQIWLRGGEVNFSIQDMLAYNMSETIAMQEAAVATCVRIITTSVCQLPLGLFQRTGRQSNPVRMHPLSYMFDGRFNDVQNAFEFRELLVKNLLLGGNFYGVLGHSRGELEKITPIEPNMVQPFCYNATGQSSFNQIIPGSKLAFRATLPTMGQKIMLPSEMWHVKAMSINGLVGLNPISFHRETIGLALAARGHATNMLKNGNSLSGILEYPGKLSPNAEENLKKGFDEAYKKASLENSIAVTQEGAKFVPTTMTNKDAQYLEARKFQKLEIGGLFGIPPHMFGDLERSPFNNIEHLSREFVMFCLGHWLSRIESAINCGLLSEKERKKGMYARHDFRGLLRGDEDSRSKFYSTCIQNAVMTPNEAREMEGLNPIEGADDLLFPLNMTRGAQDQNLTDVNQKATGEPEPAKGPGGHEPDGTGPHGAGAGPGDGKADGSGQDKTKAKGEQEE